MKRNHRNESGLQSRAEQLSVEQPTVKQPLPPLDFTLRRENRRMNTEALLDLLRNQSPGFWEIAEVVGKWVWVQFEEKQPREVTSVLSQLGFHWNNRRQVWQHPCGTITEASLYDPRRKYRSYFPADAKTA